MGNSKKKTEFKSAGFNCISVCKKVLSLTVGSYPCLFCGCDFANKRQLLCQFEVNVKLSYF